MTSNLSLPNDDCAAQGRTTMESLAAGTSADSAEVPGLVSVIIATYNSAEYLQECLHSVLTQTYTRMEVFVVDDGSTDNTRQVLEPYVATQKIQYLYQPNRGPAAARNLALRHARGEFIAFLDADDTWLPDKLEAQIAVLRRNPDVGMVYTDSEWFGEEWDRQRAQSRKLREYDRRRAEYFRRGDIFKVLMRHNFIASITLLVRHSVLKKAGPFLENIGGKRFSYGEDFELWLRIARISNVEFSLQKSAKRRVHAGQLTGDKRYGYRQLCALYKYLLTQDYCNEKALAARLYVTNLLKLIVTAVVRR